MRRSIHFSLILVLVYLLIGEDVSQAGEMAPPFSLPRWGTENRISLDDFKGQIVVLDFFNASCVKCFRSSWEIENDIQEFYTSRSGNPHGIPVKVISINCEASDSEDLNSFIEENEPGIVLNDSDGAVLQQYGGTTVPYLVVIDATGIEPNDSVPRVLYRSGFEGTDKLREIIDTITGQVEPIESNHVTSLDRKAGIVASLPAEKERGVSHENGLDMAALIASDVFVTDMVAEYRQKRKAVEFNLAVSYRHIDVDYMAEYLDNRLEDNLTANWISVQSSVDFDLDKNLTLTFGGGGYDGFQTYRALWLDQYYRHIFNVLSELYNDLEEYREASPRGYNVSSGLRWEYLPDTGFADVSISYHHDVVSPGYEISIPVVRLRDTYDTISGRLTFENVLTRRMRTLAELRITDTTERNVRFALQGALNYALAENWVMRLVVAGSKENPKFTSKSISAVLEHDWHSTWFMSVFGRYYEDTSEISNAIASNAAAPPIETWQAGLGVRWLGHRSSFKLVAGPCFSRYDREPQHDTSFEQLYKDRNWISVQAAFLHQF